MNILFFLTPKAMCAYGDADDTIREAMGEDAKTFDFKNYIDDCWKYAMEHSDTQLKTAQKPVKAEKKG